MVRRIYVEKKQGFDVEARGLLSDIRENLGITEVSRVRMLNRYDMDGIFIKVLGIANPEVGSGAWIHDPFFDIDEESLKVGCGMHVAMAFEYLNGGF